MPETIEQVDLFEGLPAIFRAAADEPRTTQRWDLSRPWRDSGFVYASDGRIIVRMAEAALEWHVVDRIPRRNILTPGASVRTGDAPGRQPRAADVYERFDAIEDDRLWLPSVLVGRLACPDCRGTGGWTDPETGERYTTAHGEAFACDDCDGVGTVPDYEPIEVAPGYFLAAWLVALLWRHGASAYRARTRGVAPSEAPTWFVCQGAEGLAMPIDPKRREDRP